MHEIKKNKKIIGLEVERKFPVSLAMVCMLLITIVMGACDETSDQLEKKQVYDGAVRSAEKVEMYYSEDASKKIKLIADKLLEFKEGNREFPDGIFLEFYDEDAKLSSTLKANYAYYKKEENLWHATGDVIVKSFEKNQQLNSEELFWKPDDEQIYTNKFVTIRIGNDIIYGTGLESNQTFTEYEIKNPKGEFEVE